MLVLIVRNSAVGKHFPFKREIVFPPSGIYETKYEI